MTDFSSTSIISSLNAHNNFRLGCRGIVNTVCAVSIVIAQSVCLFLLSFTFPSFLPLLTHICETVWGRWTQGTIRGHRGSWKATRGRWGGRRFFRIRVLLREIIHQSSPTSTYRKREWSTSEREREISRRERYDLM